MYTWIGSSTSSQIDLVRAMSLITEYSECLFITDSFYVRWLRSNYHNEVRESDSNDMTFGAQTIVDSVKIAAEV